jgi:hypothetical protein
MTYLLLLALQLCGAIFFVRHELLEFRQVVINPGEQLSRDFISDFLSVGIACIMQSAFWLRVYYFQFRFDGRIDF